MKPKPVSSMHRPTPAASRSIRAPSASSRSAEPDGLRAERLPCLATAQPAPAAISAAVVETLKLRRPPPVPAVSRQVRGVRVDADRQLAHRVRQPGELVDRLALGAQRDQKPGDLRRRHRAAHDLGEYRRGLGGAQVAPAGDRVERLGDQLVGLLAHAVSPPRKFASRAIPSSVSTDSGWNWTPSAGSSRWRMPISTPSPRALTSRQSGRSSATISEW